jgi:hypothetical protein
MNGGNKRLVRGKQNDVGHLLWQPFKWRLAVRQDNYAELPFKSRAGNFSDWGIRLRETKARLTYSDIARRRFGQ